MAAAKKGLQVFDDSFSIMSDDLNQTVLFSDIESAEIVDDPDFNLGHMVKGSARMYKWVGQFHNPAFGDYQLYMHTDVHCLIVVRYGSGKVLAMNKSTMAETREVARKLGAIEED